MGHVRRLSRRGSSARECLATALLVGLLVAGCSAQDEVTADAGWVEPGWMAQLRQDNEEYQSAQIACYAEYGLTPVRNMIGGVGFVNLPDDPATLALLDTASADCNERVPLPGFHQNKTLDDAAYARQLELRQCLIAHGYDMPEPPSVEVWKDTSPWYDAWNPYDDLVGADPGAVPQDELFALADACPQPGPTYELVAPTGP